MGMYDGKTTQPAFFDVFNGGDKRQYSLDYALQLYDNNTKTLRASILGDTSLDSVSQQDLISQLDAGINATKSANTTNADTFDQITLAYMNQVQTALTAKNQARIDASKAANDAAQQSLTNTPGRNQTILTDRATTPSGTPTLITGK